MVKPSENRNIRTGFPASSTLAAWSLRLSKNSRSLDCCVKCNCRNFWMTSRCECFRLRSKYQWMQIKVNNVIRKDYNNLRLFISSSEALLQISHVWNEPFAFSNLILPSFSSFANADLKVPILATVSLLACWCAWYCKYSEWNDATSTKGTT